MIKGKLTVNREIEKADDEKREAAARKVTEGEYRVKRKGRDFGLSDSEDEDGKFKRKKIDKITRRKMRDMRKEDVVLIGELLCSACLPEVSSQTFNGTLQKWTTSD